MKYLPVGLYILTLPIVGKKGVESRFVFAKNGFEFKFYFKFEVECFLQNLTYLHFSLTSHEVTNDNIIRESRLNKIIYED